MDRRMVPVVDALVLELLQRLSWECVVEAGWNHEALGVGHIGQQAETGLRGCR